MSYTVHAGGTKHPSGSISFAIQPDVDCDAANLNGDGTNPATGSAVSLWTSTGEFGVSWSPAQGTAGKRPIYRSPNTAGVIKNVPAVEFDGVDDLLTVPASLGDQAQPYVIAAVMRLTSFPGGGCVPISSFTAGTRQEMLVSAAGLISWDNGGFVSTTQSFTANKYELVILSANGASSFQRKSGQQSANFNLAAIAVNGITLGGEGSGGGFYAPLQIARICYWFGAKATALVLPDVETSIVNSYGITPQ